MAIEHIQRQAAAYYIFARLLFPIIQFFHLLAKKMEWQDALYVVNELPEWRFPDSVLLIGWMVECGGPDMGRGPARARFHLKSPEHYVG